MDANKTNAVAIADAEYALATALIMEDRDAEARAAYARAADLYEMAGCCEELVRYTRECAEACCVVGG